jgi:hypothetical protein
MSLFSKLFGEKKLEKENIRSTNEDQNPSYEKQLKSDFGLDYGKGGWAFEGGKIVDDMVDQFRNPDICLGILKKIRGLPGTQFSQICIVGSNKMVILVCNTNPSPSCFVTGLDMSSVAKLISLSINEGGKVFEYRRTWLLTL